MEAFTVLTAVAAPLVKANIDTDIIIPSREMKTVGKTGLAGGLFAGWRYTAIGGREPNPEFVLNLPAYADARIILGGDNFGCGSSREHAVWALHEFGIRCVIAPSFAPIFENNCVRNGILPLRLGLEDVEQIAGGIAPDPAHLPVTVDLAAQTVSLPDDRVWRFEIGDEPKTMLLNGLDAVGVTLQRADEIAAWRAGDRVERPWVYI